jgi:hypothetical protein
MPYHRLEPLFQALPPPTLSMGLGHCCDFLLASPFPWVLPKGSVPVLAALVIQGWFEKLCGAGRLGGAG